VKRLRIFWFVIWELVGRFSGVMPKGLKVLRYNWLVFLTGVSGIIME